MTDTLLTVDTLAERDALAPPTTHVVVRETGETYRRDAGATQYVTEEKRPAQVINAKAKGALGDGSGWTIQQYNTSIGQPASYRRADWVGIYADSDTMDYAGLQEAYYAAFGAPGAENSSGGSAANYGLYIPGGSYQVNQTLKWNRTLSPHIWGDGKQTTRIYMTSCNRPLVRTNGFSFGTVADIGFFSSPSASNPENLNDVNAQSYSVRGALFELDWDGQSAAAAGLSDVAVASATQPGLAATGSPGWATNAHAGRYLWLVSGTGAGASVNGLAGTVRKISGNTASALTIDDMWDYWNGRYANTWMTAGSNVLNADSSIFAATDVGREITVFGVGPSGGAILTTITGFTSPTQVTVSMNATTTVASTHPTYFAITNTPDGSTKFVISDMPVARSDGSPGCWHYAEGYQGLSTANTLNKSLNHVSDWSGYGAFYLDGGDSKYWALNAHAGRWVLIVNGTGAGQYRQIYYNDHRTLYIGTPITGLGTTASSTTVTAPTGSFTSGMTGSTVVVPGAGASGGDLITTFTYVSSSQGTLGVAASTTVSNKTGGVGNTPWNVVPNGSTAPSCYIIVQNQPVGIDNNTPYTVSTSSVVHPTLTVTGTPTWTLNQFANLDAVIVSGTGKGTKNVCMANNTAGRLTFEQPWDVLPDSTSVIRIYARVNWSASLQGDVFVNCIWSAEGADVGYLVRCPRHGNGAQGSENHFIGCFFNWARKAGFCSNGANALQNTFWGGNMQSYRKHGIWCVRGAAYAYSMGFQSDWKAQLANLGYELACDNSADDHSAMDSCRIEGFRMAAAGNFHQLNVARSYNVLGMGQWAPSSRYNVGDIILPSGNAPVALRGYIMQCTRTFGNALSAATEPVWNSDVAGGIILDNNVEWSQVQVLSLMGENISARDTGLMLGQIFIADECFTGSRFENLTVSRLDWQANPYNYYPSVSMTSWKGVTVHVGGGPNDSLFAYPYPVNGSARVFKAVDFHGGGDAVAFGGSDPTTGRYLPVVGFRRGDWSATGTNGLLGVFGIIGRESPLDYSGAGAHTLPSYLTDSKGEDQIVAAGISTGDATTANANDATGDGKIRFQTAGIGSSGNTPNALVDRVTIDKNGTMTHIGGMVVAVDAQSIANGGSFTPNAATKRVVRLTLTGSAATVNNPSNAVDGSVLELEVLNSAGATSLTLGSAFLGAFPLGATGKWRTQAYRYDGTAAKWKPLGAQSADL